MNKALRISFELRNTYRVNAILYSLRQIPVSYTHLVFAHMTPAVCDFATLEKLLSCAKKHCFLVKPARRTDKVQDEAFAQAGVPLQRAQMDDMIQNTFAFLWMMGICPEVTYRDEIWQIRRTTEDMTQWCACLLYTSPAIMPDETSVPTT